MKTINFKTSGFFYNLTKFYYKENATDTCAYKSQLIMSIIATIVTIHASILRTLFIRFNTFDKGAKIHVIFTLLSILVTFLGFVFFEKHIDFIYWRELSFIEMFLYSLIPLFIGLVVMGIISITITGVVFLIDFILKKIGYLWSKMVPKKLTVFNADIEEIKNIEPNTQIGTIYKSAKEKWCSKINWE